MSSGGKWDDRPGQPVGGEVQAPQVRPIPPTPAGRPPGQLVGGEVQSPQASQLPPAPAGRSPVSPLRALGPASVTRLGDAADRHTVPGRHRLRLRSSSATAVPARALFSPSSVLQSLTRPGLAAGLGAAVPLEHPLVTAMVTVTVAALVHRLHRQRE